MFKRALVLCLMALLVPAEPIWAQGARDAARSTQWLWCPEQPHLTLRPSLQEGVDLEPHHAAVLAACAEQTAREEPSSARFALEMTATADFLMIHAKFGSNFPDLSCR
jgi:hypothetical protein